MSLFATKSIDLIIAEANETGEHTLSKSLSSVDLIMLRPTGMRLLGSDGWRAAVDRLARETANGDLRRQIESAR